MTIFTEKEIDYLKALVEAEKDFANFFRGFGKKTNTEKNKEKWRNNIINKLDCLLILK